MGEGASMVVVVVVGAVVGGVEWGGVSAWGVWWG